ncbi:MAG TPA: TetR/AcrR family transcriptional regulator [Flavobacteriales bacterium]|jgi:AcrR family transcriptional regulator|nr:TetR/AcrR family transcriptional regulator [Flavobacteriales bacterium]
MTEKISLLDQQGPEPSDSKGLRIVEEATKVFWKYGIRSVTMDDVARHLGISKKTLYQYVTDKSDLVTKVLNNTSDRFSVEIDRIRANGHNAIDEMLAIASYISKQISAFHPSIYFDLAKYYPEACRIMDKNKQVLVVEQIAENMRKGMREGLYRADMNVPLLAKLYVVRFDHAMTMEMGQQTGLGLAEMNWELFRYHIHGIASDKGIKYLEKKVTKERIEP